jgi:heme-degrading monooxygenase HmoA
MTPRRFPAAMDGHRARRILLGSGRQRSDGRNFQAILVAQALGAAVLCHQNSGAAIVITARWPANECGRRPGRRQPSELSAQPCLIWRAIFYANKPRRSPHVYRHEPVLDNVPGFVEVRLLKGPEAEDHTLYASHTVWKNRAAFEAWTQSEAFRAAHHRAGENKPLYLGHPQFEGFEVRQTVGMGEAQVA